MSLIRRRPVPELPNAPRIQSIAKDIRRTYPTGRQEFSRAFAGSVMELAISCEEPFPSNTLVSLVTTLNAKPGMEWLNLPFERADDRTFTCRIVPDRPGLFSFWARFSTDGGITWVHDPVPDAWVVVDPPQVDRMRLYTLIPNASGTIADWTNALPHIQSMGFDTVHLLPITTLDTSQSPYSAKDLFSVDPRYLADGSGASDGLAQLEAFVARAAELKVRLCFDLVLNHVGVDSHIATRAPSWIMPDPASPDGLRRARCWNEQGWLVWQDLVMIDYEHPAQRTRSDLWGYMTEYALFWAHYASQTDGFVRFDNLHSSDKGFVDALTEVLRTEYPNVAIIAEYFTDSGTLLTTIPKWGLNLILATPWDSRFVPQLREYLKYLHSLSKHVRFFMPITSHDSGSPAQEFGAVESTVPRYVAAALLGTGATGITQGVEWGIKERINFINAQARYAPAGEPDFAKFLGRVNEILAGEPTFRRGGNCEFVDGHHHAIIAAFRRSDAPGERGFLVICNFDILGEHLFEVDLSRFLGEGREIRGTELLGGTVMTFASAKVSVIVPACAAMVIRF